MANNTTLMVKNKPVLEFNIDDGYYSIHSQNLLPYPLKGSITDTTIQSSREIERKNERTLIEFLSKRVLSLDRENAKKLLNAYNLSQSQDPYTKARIAIACKAISMTDSYWLNDGSYSWEDINPRNMHLSDVVANITLHGKSLTLTGLPHTPELTGHGTYAKAWRREDDGIYLYKKGSKDNNEPQIEVSASKILDCFNVEHVNYSLIKNKTSYMSKCKNMSTDNLAMVSAEEIYSYCSRNDKNFFLYIRGIDKDSINKMCIMDYLLSNSDRHMMNWGFYQDNNSGKLLCCHPLFDHNNCFDPDLMFSDDIKSLVFDMSMKEAAEKGLKETPLFLTKPIEISMFINKEMAESFYEKASKLGLYKQLSKGRYVASCKIKEYKHIDYEEYAKNSLRR